MTFLVTYNNKKYIYIYVHTYSYSVLHTHKTERNILCTVTSKTIHIYVCPEMCQLLFISL